jgi:hypothetical protein
MPLPNRIDPKAFNLPPRTVIEEDVDGHLTLVIDRKSRLIMADGRKIIAKAEIIRMSGCNKPINLRTTAPICSKTIKYLTEHDVKII